jgi:dihydrolipoamide dehydrogenase
MEKFDLCIIGAGPGGYSAALRAAALGLTTALVEKRALPGGTCLHVGCIPSKALLESSELFHRVTAEASEHGIGVVSPTLDVEAMLARKEAVVNDLSTGLAFLLKKRGVKVFQGQGRLAGPGHVQVLPAAGEMLELAATNIILASGSVASELPCLPFDGHSVLSSTEALSLPQVPASLAVIGAGAVGLELGQVWMRLGAKVTVLELAPGVAPFADQQAAKELQRSLKRQGMDYSLGVRVTGGNVADGKVTLSYTDAKGRDCSLEVAKVLVAAGRRPFCADLGLETVGLVPNRRGGLDVDERLACAPGIYAIGDLVRGPMLAHKAQDEGVALVELLAGLRQSLPELLVPSVVYTDPELAQVGATQEELEQAGTPFCCGVFHFRANGRARTMGAEAGFAKVLAAPDGGKVLGVHMVGRLVSELLPEATLAIRHGLSAKDIAESTHAHPTLSEALREAAAAACGRGVH